MEIGIDSGKTNPYKRKSPKKHFSGRHAFMIFVMAMMLLKNEVSKCYGGSLQVY